MFGPWESFEECVADMMQHYDEETAQKVCAALHHKLTGEWPGQSSPVAKGAELAGPIVRKNEAQRIAYAPVLVPGEADSDGEILTKDEIERVAHEWMASYRNTDVHHSMNNVAVPVESYITPQPMMVTAYGKSYTVPEGTWIMGAKFHPEPWEAIMKGELTGFSIMGVKRDSLNAAYKGEEALKRTLLRDLGPDWVPVFVSAVDEPAVPKAKFFAFKAAGWWSRLMGKKEGRVVSDSNYKKLKAAMEALTDLLGLAERERGAKESEVDMTKEELQEVLKESIDSALAPIHERLEAVEKGQEPEEPEAPDALQSEIDALKERLSDAEGKVETLEAEKQSLEQDVEAAKATLEAAKSRLRISPRALSEEGEAPPVQKNRDTFGRFRPQGGSK